MNIREKILCLKCDQEFTDERYLIQHYRIVHKDIPPGFEEKEKFMCDQCPSVFFNKLSLKLHCKNKHTKGGSGASKSFHKKCPHCGKRFSSYLMWHEHVKGQEISEINCGLVSSIFQKNNQKNSLISAIASKKWSNWTEIRDFLFFIFFGKLKTPEFRSEIS